MSASAPVSAGWSRPEALLLDAMGTLISLRRPLGATYAEAAADHGLAVDPGAIDAAFRTVYAEAPPLAFPGLGGEALREAEIGWWGGRIDAVLQATLGRPGPVALHRRLFEAFADPALWRVYDDVPAMLERWSEAGIRLAVVSNFDSRLPGLLEGLGIGAWIGPVVVSSSAGAAKPSPLPFQLALEALDVAAERAWHVGDSPEDEAGARAAGVRCLIVRRP
ncbi:MAG: HAD-IA family hydrolase [Cyanobium sp.]